MGGEEQLCVDAPQGQQGIAQQLANGRGVPSGHSVDPLIEPVKYPYPPPMGYVGYG